MTTLPDGWTVRRPTLDDVPEILKLVHASDLASVGEPDYTAEEVREMLTAAISSVASVSGARSRQLWAITTDSLANRLLWAGRSSSTGNRIKSSASCPNRSRCHERSCRR